MTRIRPDRNKLKEAKGLYKEGLLLRREIAVRTGISENTLKVYISHWIHTDQLPPRPPGRKPLDHARRLGKEGADVLEQKARLGDRNIDLAAQYHLKPPSLSSFLKPRLGYDRRAYRSHAKVMAIEMKRQGLGTREAARRAGVPESTLRLWLKKSVTV